MEYIHDLNSTLAQFVLLDDTPMPIYSIDQSKGNFWQINSIVFCNNWIDSHITYWLCLFGETLNQSKQYLLYNQSLKAGETFVAKIDTPVRAWDKVFAFVDNGSTISVNVFGLEWANR